MYRHNEKQLKFVDFHLPFGGQLSPDNRWVRLARMIPWDEFEESYCANLSKSGQGPPALSVRMALFGAPVAHEDHAQRACHAALAIQRALKDYGTDFKKTYGIDFAMRIGLNSGPVVVGSIGDDLRMDYTAIGNTTNLASRMETLAEPGTILVSIVSVHK